MKILICGNSDRTQELRGLIPEEHEVYESSELSPELIESRQDCDLFFDLNADDHPGKIGPLLKIDHKPVFLSSVKKQLAEMIGKDTEVNSYVFGINALPGFMERGMLEVSMLDESNQAYSQLKENLELLQIDFQRVDDRAGLVSPRVIMMIINEACYTLQEGTANKQDIDLSLKLGTNYPYGPFEWADIIGIKDVYETLNAIYEDTRDERYKICPLLKTYYLKGQPFFE